MEPTALAAAGVLSPQVSVARVSVPGLLLPACARPRAGWRGGWAGSSEEGDRAQSGQGAGGREAPKSCTNPQHRFRHRVGTKTSSLLAIQGQPLCPSLGQPTRGGSALGGGMGRGLGVPPWGAERPGHPEPLPRSSTLRPGLRPLGGSAAQPSAESVGKRG